MGEFVIFGTTADEGMELVANSLEELFAMAVKGFLTILFGEDARPVNPVETRKVEVECKERTGMLVGMVNELIYLFDAHGWVPCRAIRVEVLEDRLRVVLQGEPYDPHIHSQPAGIKAATYHKAAVYQQDEIWHGKLVLDI